METKKADNSEIKRGLKCYKEDMAKRILFTVTKLHCAMITTPSDKHDRA
jgi:hypothetical protein